MLTTALFVSLSVHFTVTLWQVIQHYQVQINLLLAISKQQYVNITLTVKCYYTDLFSACN